MPFMVHEYYHKTMYRKVYKRVAQSSNHDNSSSGWAAGVSVSQHKLVYLSILKILNPLIVDLVLRYLYSIMCENTIHSCRLDIVIKLMTSILALSDILCNQFLHATFIQSVESQDLVKIIASKFSP